ncbi:ras guanine nucleotide exchange factor domain-containing protein [Fimicolochytrium jonesii]|uniref:ras guanine nucleotide exchange factor domain-containing protein n=1 Tax=Fimicolochytrium jonesii TaxID=1396493 RepID=UPI0022FDD52A|nr:ras guanine nucleotide exchange factor domain-containing protein [Fimicolochytrium jonesii]KAI8818638.1 ras guanine nucleotide exchange factor domain-containing protein [Fimicolochytrium jonesii]
MSTVIGLLTERDARGLSEYIESLKDVQDEHDVNTYKPNRPETEGESLTAPTDDEGPDSRRPPRIRTGSHESSKSVELEELNRADSEGNTPVHFAVTSNLECLDVLLSEPSIAVNSPNTSGATPLHIAAAEADMAIVKRLIRAGANAQVADSEGKRPADCATDPEIRAYLTEQIAVPRPVPPKRKSSHLIELESQLPQDFNTLKALCIDLVVSQSVFQARCKETVRQLLEEKHVALHKNRLLEAAAGIQDKETSERFIDQLHSLQDHIEKQANTISYLETSLQLFEYAAAQQDEYYRKNMADLTKQHHSQLQAIMRRSEETESSFMAYQKAHSLETAELQRLRTESNLQDKARETMPRSTAIPAEQRTLLAETQTLRKQLSDVIAEKVAVDERLKLTEKLKALSEEETVALREDMGKLRQRMQQEVLKQLQTTREAKDDVDESSGNIVFIRGEGGQKRLKGGTREKLLERLIDPAVHDHHFQETILLTHGSFMSTGEMLEAILAKYREIAKGKDEEASLQSPILLRIVNLLKFWIEHHWRDFEDDENLKKVLGDFIEDSFKESKMGLGLRIAFERKTSEVMESEDLLPVAPKPLLPKFLAKRYSQDVSSSLMSGSSKTLSILADKPSGWVPFGGGKGSKVLEGVEEVKLRFLDLEAIELARQLTLLEFDLFKSIRSSEYLDLNWIGDNRETDAPNILRMTRWSNHVVQWLVTEIVTAKDNVKTRAAVFEKTVALGQALDKLKNFNGVKEIVAALQTSSVYRLKKTKEAVSSKYMRMYDELVKSVSSELNYKHLRAAIRASDPPLIPFPGLYQGDLVFIDTCQKNKIDGGLINYQKLESISRTLMELEAYQQVPFALEPITEIQDYIRNHVNLDDDQAYNASLACEAKPGAS